MVLECALCSHVYVRAWDKTKHIFLLSHFGWQPPIALRLATCYICIVLAICLLKDIMAGLSRCFIYTYTHICVDKPLVMSLWSGAPNGPCRNILRGFQTPLPAALILTNSLILNGTYLCVHCARGVQYLL